MALQNAHELADFNAKQQKREQKFVADLQAFAPEVFRVLEDIAHKGLAEILYDEGGTTLEFLARRLVDLKASALAQPLRDLPARARLEKEGYRLVLNELVTVRTIFQYLLDFDQLTAPQRYSLLQRLGFRFNKEWQMANFQGVEDHWLVISQVYEQLESLTQRKSYLLGQHSGLFGVFIDYAFGNQGYKQQGLLPGKRTRAWVWPYPSETGRIQVFTDPNELCPVAKFVTASETEVPQTPLPLRTFANLAEMRRHQLEQLSRHPWNPRVFGLLEDGRVMHTPDGLLFQSEGHAPLALQGTDEQQWAAAAVGNLPEVFPFVELNEETVSILAIEYQGQIEALA